ncbi:MAG TPA: hypothetical protein DDY32_18310 [Desulfobulbaceae bacterium]|nr:hypothetical protein [Desulfobulbaceae bacterium]
MSENPTTGGGKIYRFPWWGSVLLAIVCYCTLNYLVPQFEPAHPVLAELVKAAPFFAPIVAIPLLLLAAKQLYDTDKKGDEDPDHGDGNNRGE